MKKALYKQSEKKTVASVETVISIFKWKNFVTLKEYFNFLENELSFQEFHDKINFTFSMR